MTALKERMIEDLQLHGYADKTQESYLRAVSQLSEYCNKPPDQITEDELRGYFLYLKNEKGASRSSLPGSFVRHQILLSEDLAEGMACSGSNPVST